MTEHTISLPESIYLKLIETSQAKGLSPANWIATQLVDSSDDEQKAAKPSAKPSENPKPLSELLSGLTGTVESKAEPLNIYSKTAFGAGVAAKLAKQGIHLP
jgi:hypothetical protein